MKKFLVLTVVLGLASLASAAVAPLPTLGTYADSFTLGNVDWTLDIDNNQIIGTGTVLGLYDESFYIYPSANGASTTFAASKGAYAAAGDTGAFTGTGIIVAHAQDQDAEIMPNQSLGEWFYINLTPGTDGQFCLLYVDGSDYNVGLTCEVKNGELIPEPMTIALLGLGGLFLRRRK